MNEEIIYEVIKKLIGNINPVGETHTDDERFENLKIMCNITDRLLIDIDDMAYRNSGMHQYSIKRAVTHAIDFYKTIGIE